MTPAAPDQTATLHLMTAPRPGAVAILQLSGGGALAVAHRLIGHAPPSDGRLALRDLGGIDTGLVGVLSSRHGPVVQLMPHGGPRVVQKLTQRLIEWGASHHDRPDAQTLYPEAACPIEADALLATAEAPSPAAIGLLAAQPALWQAWWGRERAGKQESRRTGNQVEPCDPGSDFLLSCSLDLLLRPPAVVIVGRPNVGKSTLTNTMLGRAVSIVSDLPGTTRDWVGALAELGPPAYAVAVRWLDTPGLRRSQDAIEQEAIALARRVIAAADVLIAMRDPDRGWPDPAALPRTPDLWVMNKIDAPPDAADTTGRDAQDPLMISALHDQGVHGLASRVIHALGLSDLETPRLWPFSPTLRRCVAGEPVDMRGYLGLGD